MKRVPFVLLSLAIVLASCNKKPEAKNPPVLDEKTAIANFKAEIYRTSDWIDEQQKSVRRNAADGPEIVVQITDRLKGISTDGLPADLKAAWKDMNDILAEMNEVFKGVPRRDPSKPGGMNRGMQEMMPKMMTIQTKMQPISRRLIEAGRKYGIDFDRVMPNRR